uniref:Uncharacterized protein n=1 Tax=Glossina austeni TaxID=7395 RepID=A0A1A9UUV0_GLOAU
MLHVVVLARLVKVPLPPAALLLEFVLLSAAQLFTLPGERHLSNDKCCLARLKVERNWELPAEVADVDDVTPTAEEPPLALKLPPAIVLPLNLTEAAPLGNCCCCCRAASLQRLMALF